MKLFNQIIWRLAATVIGATVITHVLHAQEINPNKLPQCPKPDYSKKDPYKRGKKWTNCWGRIKINPEEILEGEWKDGKPSGRFMANYYGAKFIIDFKDGNLGQGSVKFPNGTNYVGEFKGDDLDGQGTLTYANGDKYTGYFRKNSLQGKGTYTFTNGDRYVGEFSGWDNMPKGVGTFTFANGDKYQGESQEDEFRGHDTTGKLFKAFWVPRTHEKSPAQLSVPDVIYNGLMLVRHEFTMPDLNVNTNTHTDRTEIELAQKNNPNNLPSCPKPDYSKKTDIERFKKWINCWGRYKFELDLINLIIEGEFLNGRMTGFGKHEYPDGSNYVGSIKNFLKHGQGTETSASGDQYIGEFKDDKYNGYGTYIYADGEKYIGEFKDGKKNGHATTNYANGDKYVGEFKDNKKHGLGTYTFTNSEKYVGEFKDGKYNGQGTYIYANGDEYVGEFKDNYRSGQGILTSVNGEKNEGIWEKDNFIRVAKVDLLSKDSHIPTKTASTETESIKSGYIIENNSGCKFFTVDTRRVISAWSGLCRDGYAEGQGTLVLQKGSDTFLFEGNLSNGMAHGFGKFKHPNGITYVGEFLNGLLNGQGTLTYADGSKIEGVWENNKLIREKKINPPSQNNNTATNTDRTEIERERQQLAEERRRLEEEKQQRAQQRRSERVNLQITHTQPIIDGSFTINIRTNTDTASLKINGEEQGGRANGDYTVKKVARAGQETTFTVVATDINGNTDTKSITVSRAIVESKASYTALNPGQVKQQPPRDAVGIIIGIADYKSLPKADFANDDARAFYDYAIRALGIKPENIKLLVDADAEEVEILRTFRNWLPSKVQSTTDVYVFYSGHGLPTPDGQGLYLIPPRAARDLIDDTAIPFSKINAALQTTKPKSVTMILDACYSGQSRSGETLVASARPVTLKTENRLFPESFTVITASQNDQISSSNPDLQHGIFSYYLMKGMEGDADANKDGKITLSEMQAYLVENVSRQAGLMNRKQEPQLVGDANRVLVGR